MSVINDLKEKNNASIIDLFEVLFPNVKTKYYTLFVSLMNNQLERKTDYIIDIKEYLMENSTDKVGANMVLEKLTPQKIVSLNYLLHQFHNDSELDVKTLSDFITYNEKNMIEKKDVSTYKNYEEMVEQVSIANIKEMGKELEKQIKVMFDDGEWLVFKPLSYKASVKYGYGTKWCTAMERDSSYFRRYATDGILIYSINRKSGLKVGLYRDFENNELSFWDVTDKRVDSFESGLPHELVAMLINDTRDNKKTNFQVLKENVGHDVDDFEKYLYDEKEYEKKLSRRLNRLKSVPQEKEFVDENGDFFDGDDSDSDVDSPVLRDRGDVFIPVRGGIMNTSEDVSEIINEG